MKYDFESIPDRSQCGASKWNAVPGASTERVPLSTADMEFPTAPAIVEALKDLAENTILGYTDPTDVYYEAVRGWMKRKHDFDVSAREIVLTPGIVYALGLLVEALSNPGDSVIIISPVYYPFDMSVVARERSILYSQLKLDGVHYSIDYEELEQLAQRPDAKLLLFCNPHNPVGRVWSREEMERVVEICDRNDVFIIDDEIHHDLIMPGYEHTVMANVSERARQICAVCTAPSKTFNLAGLQCSNIMIPDRTAYKKVVGTHTLNLLTHLNAFAYRACEAAYTRCDDWLDELIEVIAGNAAYIEQFMAENFPEVRVVPLEGTYLLWLDMRDLGMTHKELEVLMKEEAGLYLDEGYIFGASARGFERINLACSRKTLERSMERFKNAMDARRALWDQQGRPYHKTLEAGDVLEGFIYDTAEQSGLDLAQTISKPTILVFSRYYTCSICQMLLSQLRALWPEIDKAGCDLKVVLQSTQESIAKAAQDHPFPFDLVCDPDAKLYDRYNVFEADSSLAMVGGDVKNMKAMGGVRQVVISGLDSKKPEGRSQQLPAVFAVDPDGKVTYAYYAKTVFDLPDFKEIVSKISN